MFPCDDNIRPNADKGDLYYDFYRPTMTSEWDLLLEQNAGLLKLINNIREQLRETGQFELSDGIRETLLKTGCVVRDDRLCG